MHFSWKRCEHGIRTTSRSIYRSSKQIAQLSSNYFMEDLLPSTSTDKSRTWRVNSLLSSTSTIVCVMNMIITIIGLSVSQDSRCIETAFEYIALAYSITLHDGTFKEVSASNTFANNFVLFGICWPGINWEQFDCLWGPAGENFFITCTIIIVRSTNL